MQDNNKSISSEAIMRVSTTKYQHGVAHSVLSLLVLALLATAVVSETTSYSDCLECKEHEKELYIYREFPEGVMFHDAVMAPNNQDSLTHCILAPVHTKEDLIKISEVVPPCKAAYTAAYKNPLEQYSDVHSCLDMSKPPPTCGDGYDFESVFLGKGKCDISALYTAVGHSRMLEDAESAARGGGELWCPTLRDYWVNFGSKKEVPYNVWQYGEPFYCGSGPIPDAGIIPYTEYKYGYPNVGLVAVNGGMLLPGAVYKCCRELKSCIEDGNSAPTHCPVKPDRTPAPTMKPSVSPSESPSESPSIAPSQPPSETPSMSVAPSESPSKSPSVSIAPSESPSVSSAPTQSELPSMAPSVSSAPSISMEPTAVCSEDIDCIGKGNGMGGCPMCVQGVCAEGCPGNDPLSPSNVCCRVPGQGNGSNINCAQACGNNICFQNPLFDWQNATDALQVCQGPAAGKPNDKFVLCNVECPEGNCTAPLDPMGVTPFATYSPLQKCLDAINERGPP
mmetsp:Transcript_11577/g.21359  ORF Transcript_11577/g.21359 Transcript_11577/m.21359 type:complete len:507 (-) Transcript_11577:89-1609(-)